jgi:uncharacterized membrane protein (UPF0127 family)
VSVASENGFPPARLRSLPRREALGGHYPVATTLRSRLAGLALLPRAAAGPGLLIPRCRSVHTFGMRFALDVWFLGCDGEPVGVRRALGPMRVVRHRAAAAVLEVPA